MNEAVCPSCKIPLNDISVSLNSLQTNLRETQELLTSKEHDLRLSAEIGKSLLENNTQLQSQLNALLEEDSSFSEILEQEKHELRLSFDAAERRHIARIQELERDITASRLRSDEKIATFATDLRSKTAALDAAIEEAESSKADAEKMRLTTEQLRERIRKQDSELAELHKEIYGSRNGNEEGDENSVDHLLAKLADAQSKLLQQDAQLNKFKCDSAQLELDIQGLETRLNMTTELSVRKSEECERLFATIEAGRLATADLESQLADALISSQNGSLEGKTMFNEVEDRRVDAERRCRRLKRDYATMKRFLKQQMQHLKSQNESMLLMSFSRANADEVRRLEQAYSQSQGEKEQLAGQLEKSELEYHNKNVAFRKMECTMRTPKNVCGSSDINMCSSGSQAYVDLLSEELSRAESKLLNAQSELRTRRMVQISEGNKLRSAERDLYKIERRLEEANNEILRLHLRLGDAQLAVETELCDTFDSRTDLNTEVTPQPETSEKNSDAAPLKEIRTLKDKENQPKATATTMKVSQKPKVINIAKPGRSSEAECNQQ